MSTPIDQTTPHMGFELPHPENDLEDDILRLRSALLGIDTFLSNLASTLSAAAVAATVNQQIATLTNAVNQQIATLSQSLTDLNTAVSGKQATLVSGNNIKTVNGATLLGNGNVTIATGLTLTPVAGKAQNAAAGNNYALNNAAASTVLGPAAANQGDKWAITVCNGLRTNVVNWNGLKHEGISDAAMTLSSATRFDFEYISAAFGWKVNQ